MHSLNILIVGEGQSVDFIKKSMYLKKLYITSDKTIDNIINVNFNTFRELAQKCKSLQIDIVIVEDEKYILEGICDVLKKNYINCISVTSYWTNLQINNEFRNNLMTKYGIDIPQKIILPVDFPLFVKTNCMQKKAYKIQDVIDIKQEIYNSVPELAKYVYLEKYISGKDITILSIFDGKHLVTFPETDIEPILLKEYSVNLEHMLLSEKANFIGFINSHIIYSESKIYNIGFSFKFVKPNIDIDILYLLSLAIYQKLNEVNF